MTAASVTSNGLWPTTPSFLGSLHFPTNEDDRPREKTRSKNRFFFAQKLDAK
jgi:hypothetical protein